MIEKLFLTPEQLKSYQAAKSDPLWIKLLLWTHGSKNRWLRYLILYMIVIGPLWAMTITYINLAPVVYTSKWSLVLPGSGAGANININSIGQVATMSNSAYGSATLSPKVNYKAIVKSSAVIDAAANKIQMTRANFGVPRVELIAQTTLLLFSIKGSSPEQAQEKSWALYEAFQEKLNQLRRDEIQQRERGFRNVLYGFEENLNTSRQKLLSHQVNTGIVSPEQFTQLALNVETLRKELADAKVQESQSSARAEQLSAYLSFSPEQASDALTLDSDPLFRRHLQNYADAEAALAIYSNKWGPNHPKVIKETSRQKSAFASMRKRSSSILSKQDDNLLRRMILNGGDRRGILLSNLLEAYVSQRGDTERVMALKAQIQEFEHVISQETEAVAKLDDLQRNHQIAEAVFTSAIARIDTGKSDLYASYPLLQMLEEPSLPE
ncbi:MAG: hypothetical protein AAF512_15795, partial [Pseudomonadota bacterium]